MARNWLKSLGFVVFYGVAVAALVVLIDHGLQRLLVGEIVSYTERHPIYDHHLVPSSTTLVRSPAFLCEIRANSLGIRGPEIEIPRPPGVYRILMLGDSFTMGKGVAEDETFSARLEARLNRRVAELPHERYEVINAGVDSFSPLLEFLQLRHLHDAIEPNMVVVNIDMSDLLQDQGSHGLIEFDERRWPRRLNTAGTDGEDHVSRLNDRQRFIYLNFYYLAAFYRGYIEPPPHGFAMIALAAPEVVEHTLNVEQAKFDQAWSHLFQSLTWIREYCDSRSLPLLLTVYPWAHQVNERECRFAIREFVPEQYELSGRSEERIATFAADNGVPLQNVFAAFREASGREPLYFDADIHWTAAGHALMARELEPFVASQLPGAMVPPAR